MADDMLMFKTQHFLLVPDGFLYTNFLQAQQHIINNKLYINTGNRIPEGTILNTENCTHATYSLLQTPQTHIKEGSS